MKLLKTPYTDHAGGTPILLLSTQGRSSCSIRDFDRVRANEVLPRGNCTHAAQGALR